MKATILLFGFIPLPGAQAVDESHLTSYLLVAAKHNARPWYRRMTKRVIKGYRDPFKD